MLGETFPKYRTCQACGDHIYYISVILLDILKMLQPPPHINVGHNLQLLKLI